MNKIDYNLGILKRLVAGSINNEPYVMLKDAEYIIKNSGIINDDGCNSKTNTNEESSFDIRPSKWPVYYDDTDMHDYNEWFIKGTNIKLGFDFINNVTQEHLYYCVVTESYDDQIIFKNKYEFIKHLNWIINNKELSWRFYQ